MQILIIKQPLPLWRFNEATGMKKPGLCVAPALCVIFPYIGYLDI